MKIILPEKVVNKLERLNYEYSTMMENVAFLMDQHKEDVSFLESPLFLKYHSQEIEKKKEYEDAKQDMIDTYMPEEYKGKNLNWSVYFRTCELIIKEG